MEMSSGASAGGAGGVPSLSWGVLCSVGCPAVDRSCNTVKPDRSSGPLWARRGAAGPGWRGHSSQGPQVTYGGERAAPWAGLSAMGLRLSSLRSDTLGNMEETLSGRSNIQRCSGLDGVTSNGAADWSLCSRMSSRGSPLTGTAANAPLSVVNN